MNIPNKIKEIIGDMLYSIDTIGMSNSQVICFDDMVLKIEKQEEESDNEHKMMAWLANKLPVSEGFDVAMLFDELKIVPDWNKIKFYLLLDELF